MAVWQARAMNDETAEAILFRLDELKETVGIIKNQLDRMDGRLEGAEATLYAIHAELGI